MESCLSTTNKSVFSEGKAEQKQRSRDKQSDKRSDSILINGIRDTVVTEENNYFNREYELKINLFDPSKASPTNEFMTKLYRRFNNDLHVKKDIEQMSIITK